MVVPPTALKMLRRALKDRRCDFARGYGDASFVQHAVFDDLVSASRCLGLYYPMFGEPDPWPLAGHFKGVTALPALIDDEPKMAFRRWSLGDALVTTTWGGLEPPHNTPDVFPDVIIVPLVGFDAAFQRIGQGGGYYDRYLAARPSACRVGLAWNIQRIDTIAAQPWDVALDAILTETDFHIRDLTRCQNH